SSRRAQQWRGPGDRSFPGNVWIGSINAPKKSFSVASARFLGYVRAPDDKHRASGPATWANAVTAGGAVNHNAVPRHVRSAISFAVRLTGRERDPISVECLEGHLLTRRLQNAGRQGHQDADADDCAANLGGVDHNRRPRDCLPTP